MLLRHPHTTTSVLPQNYSKPCRRGLPDPNSLQCAEMLTPSTMSIAPNCGCDHLLNIKGKINFIPLKPLRRGCLLTLCKQNGLLAGCTRNKKSKIGGFQTLAHESDHGVLTHQHQCTGHPPLGVDLHTGRSPALKGWDAFSGPRWATNRKLDMI